MAEPIVRCRGLSRSFKEVEAVRSLHLSIPPGQLFGLVGPDGAGKTTTLRLLAGLLAITSGEATVAGFDLGRQVEAIKPHVGYMAQDFSLYGELSVVENLRFFAELYGLTRSQIDDRSGRLLEFAALTEFQNRRAEHLSGGMKKKLALACTLIHEPDLLLLDEPTTGVDPVSRREFWQILIELNLAGTTVIISTPYMDEADRCQRVGLIYRGALVVCDEPAAVRARLRGELVELEPKDWRRARSLVADLPGILEVMTYGQSLHLLVDSAQERQPQIERALTEAGLDFQSLAQAEPRMEEAFISLIREMQEREN